MNGPNENGGPAFPAPDLGELNFGYRGAYPGMGLRDYFAAKAMQAAAVNAQGVETFEQRAVWAYQQADAMLKARGAA